MNALHLTYHGHVWISLNEVPYVPHLRIQIRSPYISYPSRHAALVMIFNSGRIACPWWEVGECVSCPVLARGSSVTIVSKPVVMTL